MTADGLLYRGRVGSGIGPKAGVQLAKLLAGRDRDDSPFDDEVPRVDALGTHWVEPFLVVDVDSHATAKNQRLRQPSYRGVRADLSPEDLLTMSPKESGQEVRVDVEGRTLKLSNLDKVLYPRTGTTKGEVLNYYAQVAPAMLPLLDRPLRDPGPLAQRRGEAELLREEHPERHAVVGAHGRGADDRVASPGKWSGAQRRRPGLPGRRRPRHLDLAGQPGRARAARAPVDGHQERQDRRAPTGSSSTSTRATAPASTSAARWPCSCATSWPSATSRPRR